MSGLATGRELGGSGTATELGGGRTRGGRGWIAFACVNALIVFFGLSYIFFPMGTVVADGNRTTGILQIPRELWGSYVVVCAAVALGLALYAFRTRRRWARNALVCEFVFLATVAAVEPDPVVPTILALVLALFLLRARPWFSATGAAGRAAP